RRIRSSEITSEINYLDRRRFLEGSLFAGASLLAHGAGAARMPLAPSVKLNGIASSALSTDETPNSFEDVTTYNNFYEFGTGKADPSENAQEFKPLPWTIEITGHAEHTGRFQLEDFIKPHQLQERIYRM